MMRGKSMKVTVVFDHAFDPGATQLGEAYWLVDTAHNRAVDKKLHRTGRFDPNSAIFDWSEESRPSEGLLWSIFDHHPDCRELEFIGASADEWRQLLSDEGFSVSNLGGSFLATEKPEERQAVRAVREAAWRKT